jgi:hypothetical protein
MSAGNALPTNAWIAANFAKLPRIAVYSLAQLHGFQELKNDYALNANGFATIRIEASVPNLTNPMCR